MMMTICCCYSIPSFFVYIISTSLLLSSYSSVAQYQTSNANLSTSWINQIYNLTDILRTEPFACAFFCSGNNPCDDYVFSIYIDSYKYAVPQPIVWTANPINPVKANATLNLTADGDLILQDVDGTVAWSTNTSGRSVARLNLAEDGNLILFDANNAVVWQSFDHPTDTLLFGQKLALGKKLTTISGLLSLSSKGTQKPEAPFYSFGLTDEGLVFNMESNPPERYFFFPSYNQPNEQNSYVRFLNLSLQSFIRVNSTELPQGLYPPNGDHAQDYSSLQFMKLDTDGHLRIYDNSPDKQVDFLSGRLDACEYPMACGRYSVCSCSRRNDVCNTGQCRCPSTLGSNYFSPVDANNLTLGCSLNTPVTCNPSQDHSLVDLENVRYLALPSNTFKTDAESCKGACLRNCSCKAAMFSSYGDCYLPSEIFSLKYDEQASGGFYFSVSVKIASPKRKKLGTTILGLIIGGSILLLIIISVVCFRLWKRKNALEVEEDYLDQLPGLPTRFTFEELKAATQDFSKKLGQGGFGSVFEGTLVDGQKIAVKCLDGFTQVKKSFLAEVQSIGSIHHVNLVRLIGFCAYKSQKLLVYEYMSNGSLDKWIYNEDQEHTLDWKCRKKIVLDIAKGLAYLHEDCRQKIIHLDIKPQNILIDDSYNAKLADFGLSKLIDRDQSQVVTTMRGTPGYLAPEWLRSIVTEKVDVYSFGIVLLEILCGRKNFDRSEPEESWHLLSLFQQSLEEGTLLEIVDKHSEDMQIHGAEVVEMMKLASWCLRNDFTQRPSMSVVVKVLEGSLGMEISMENIVLHSDTGRTPAINGRDSSVLVPSILSGPR